ncbi:MAG TPA: DoxX family protein [Puia sp.]|nr:DoxX family protein [Puia sp.]
MNTLLWSCQIILALAFGYSGLCKSIYSEATLVVKKGQTGVAGLPQGAIRIIGISELLGMVGIIVPWWTGIAPVLTPITAVCFAFIMVLAAPIHYKRKEPGNVATNITLLILAVFTAYGRFGQ